MEQIPAHDSFTNEMMLLAVMKLVVCTLSNRVIKYWLRSLETDEINPLEDEL
jgi:hypothetical protein